MSLQRSPTRCRGTSGARICRQRRTSPSSRQTHGVSDISEARRQGFLAGSVTWFGDWRRRSLRRWALADRRRLKRGSASARASALTWPLWNILMRAARNGGTYIVIGISGLWAPPIIPLSAPALPDARDLLSALWQVQAAALGLTVAVVIFAFQAVATARWTMGLEQFARSTGVVPVVFIGATSLLVDGLVLAGAGRGGPDGWAGLWAATLGGITLVSVPLLFRLALREIDPATLRSRLLARISAAVQRAVDEDLLERLAFRNLRDWCAHNNVTFSVYLSPKPGQIPIKAGRSGVVADVRLRALRRVSRAAHLPSDERPHFGAFLGTGVSEDSTILVLSANSPPNAVATSSRCIKIASRPARREFDLTLAHLHQASGTAIRSGDVGWYSEIREAYTKALVAFPEAWSRYGVQFDADIAAGMSPFEITYLDRVRRDIFEHFRQVLAADHFEIAHDVAYLPIGVAMRAVPLGARGLAEQMLRLAVSMSTAPRQFGNNEIYKAVASQLDLAIFEYVEFAAASRVTRIELSLADREEAARFVLDAFPIIADYIRLKIERREHPAVAELLDRWDEVLDHWHPAGMYEIELGLSDHIDFANPDDLELSRAAVQIRQSRRTRYFELFAWVFRQITSAVEDDARALREPLELLASRVNNDQFLMQTAKEALTADHIGRWLMSVQQARKVHVVETHGLVIEALVVAWIMRPSLVPHDLLGDPGTWLSDREAGLIAAADAMRSVPIVRELLPETDVDARIDAFCSVVRVAAAEERERERLAILAAEPDDGRVAEFKSIVRKGYDDARITTLLVGHVAPVPRSEIDTPKFLGYDQYVPKDWFTANSRTITQFVSRDLGEEVARAEAKALLDLLESSSAKRFPANVPLADRVRLTIADLRAREVTPNLIIAPLNWKLPSELPLHPIDMSKVDVGVASRGWLAGGFEDIPVLQPPRWPQDRIVIADTRRYLKFRPTFVLPENDEFVVSLTFYDREEALAVAKERPTLFRTNTIRTQVQRAEELQAHTLLRMRVAFDAEVAERHAAARITIPKSLRQDVL
jgi:hypothetical protein